MPDRPDVRVLEGSLDARGAKFAVVVGRFNSFITERLLDGAVDTLVRLGAKASDITVVRVPGSFEIPAAVARLVEVGGHDAIVTLGCLIRGDTMHFDLIASQVTAGLATLSRENAVPIAFGVLTTDSLEQAIHRAGAKLGNKGAEAAQAAVEQLQLLRAISGSRPRARKKRR